MKKAEEEEEEEEEDGEGGEVCSSPLIFIEFPLDADVLQSYELRTCLISSFVLFLYL
jgi:hypothetical protein